MVVGSPTASLPTCRGGLMGHGSCRVTVVARPPTLKPASLAPTKHCFTASTVWPLGEQQAGVARKGLRGGRTMRGESGRGLCMMHDGKGKGIRGG